MKSVYSLNCTVCHSNYDGRSSWLNHLVELNHQNKAREKCVQRWFGRKAKDKSNEDEIGSLVVVFSSFSLNQLIMVESLFEKLSEIGRSGFTWISDFVWWPERDTVGYLQFESRKLVNELIEVMGGPDIQVENKLVQLKRAVDIPHLEFNALLPGEVVNQILLRENSSTTTTNLGSSISVSGMPVSSYICNPRSPLQVQFNHICKLVEIPDDQINEALKITKILKDLLTEKHKQIQVVMFRNFYLGLKNNGTNTLLIYVCVQENNSSNGFSKLEKSDQEAIFQSSVFKKCLPNYVQWPSTHRDNFEGGICFMDESTGFKFNIIGQPLRYVEAQLSLLIQYLCSFNPRVKQVLLLVHFWAITNRVKVAEEGLFCQSHQNTICFEPSALEWMVILFLSREGIIPRVREIVKRPHKPLTFRDCKLEFGFSMDSDYAAEWRNSRGIKEGATEDQIILEVVSLAEMFFNFYGTNLESGCWVLNPRDGEIIRREGTHIRKSGLSKEEIEILSSAQNGKYIKKNKDLDISRSRIFMLNPLHITWRLSFCVETWTKETCGKMQETGKRLGEYLNVIKSGGGVAGGLTLKSALSLK